MLLQNAFVFMTHRKCFEKRDILVRGDRIFMTAPSIPLSSYSDEEVLDLSGKYIVPGLVDIHMHIESSMTYPLEFSRAVLPFGVTTVVSDPHEITNVFGMEGIRSFLSQDTPMDIFYGLPSSVPAGGVDVETAGAALDAEDIASLLSKDRDFRIRCLGEVMNFGDLLREDSPTMKKIRMVQSFPGQRRIEGHCPRLSFEDTQRYVFAGVDSDHTQQTPQSIREKIDDGMFLEIQRKSLTRENLEVIRNCHLEERIALVTDDTLPDQLLLGQLDGVVREAVSLGMRPEDAVYCATWTPAQRMQFYDRGAVTPGKKADLVVIDDPKDFHARMVMKDGKILARDGKMLSEKEMTPPDQLFPGSFFHSVQAKEAGPEDFLIRVPGPDRRVTARVIGISPDSNFTNEIMMELPVINGELAFQNAGLCLVTIFERYGKTGTVTHALAAGALQERGACAATWSHDSHNLIVIGNSVEDMVLAQRTVLSHQGGYCVCSSGKVLALCPLPIGGILSDRPMEELGEQVRSIREALTSLGYHHRDALMSISTLALPVSPALKVTDKGLFDVRKRCFVPLIQEGGGDIEDKD